MSRDSRGISRGKCNLPECNCQSYMGGSDGMKCVGCGHPPGKHQNLTSPGAGSSSAAYTGGGYPTNYPSAAGSVSGCVNLCKFVSFLNLPNIHPMIAKKIVLYRLSTKLDKSRLSGLWTVCAIITRCRRLL